MSRPKRPPPDGDMIEQTHATPPADRWRWRITKRKSPGSDRANRVAAYLPALIPAPAPAPVPVTVLSDSQQERVLRVLAARQKRQRGQALVEMTLVLGIFLSLCWFLVGVGQFLLANYTVNQAARAAAHQAALSGGNSPAARDAAEMVLMSGVGTSANPDRASISIVCERPDSPGTPASVCRRYYPVTITVAYRDVFWAPVPGFPDRFVVRAQTTRAAERDQQ